MSDSRSLSLSLSLSLSACEEKGKTELTVRQIQVCIHSDELNNSTDRLENEILMRSELMKIYLC